MNHHYACALVAGAIALSVCATSPILAQDAQTPEQRIAALKKNMAQSQAQLRKYEWVETTIVSHKGEEKSRKEERCYYGADGALQKLPVGDPQPAADQGGGGRRGRMKERIVEKKKDEIQQYMENAVALVKQYVSAESQRHRCCEERRQCCGASRSGRPRSTRDHQLHQVG